MQWYVTMHHATVLTVALFIIAIVDKHWLRLYVYNYGMAPTHILYNNIMVWYYCMSHYNRRLLAIVWDIIIIHEST